MAILQVIGIGLGSLIGIIIVYLVRVIFLPFKKVPGQVVPVTNALELNGKVSEHRQNMSFVIDGDKVDGWLYLPENVEKPVPCVIMSNGFCGTKGMILEQYALRYREAGYATFTYDFRHFGLSDGEPRQLYDQSKQLEDLTVAIDKVRQLKEIDSDKIAIWGTSGSGGYGLIQAADDKKIACVIGQCPALDRHADGKLGLEQNGMGFYLRLFMHAQRDKGRSRFGLSPHTIPLLGEKGSLAFFVADNAIEGYSSLISPTFKNELCARSMILTSKNPIDYASKVDCPVLLQVCLKDNLVSESSYVDTTQILGYKAELIKYDCGHFDIYTGDEFEVTVNDQINFLKKHL